MLVSAEMGKLERTSFLLDYFQNESLRRRILIGLNKGEALHALARQLFSGKHGELWDRAFEDQMHRASCLHLIMAAIAAWNAVYLSQAVEDLKKRGETVPEEYLPHITPLGWEHINLIGQYSFSHQSARSLDTLRPLRLPDEVGQETRGELQKIAACPLIPKRECSRSTTVLSSLFKMKLLNAKTVRFLQHIEKSKRKSTLHDLERSWFSFREARLKLSRDVVSLLS